GHRHPVGGILRQELVEDGGAGAWQPDDEDRLSDILPLDLGMASQGVDDPQAVLEQAHAIGARDQAAEQRERGLVLEGVEQSPEGLAEGTVAEVVETRAARRAGKERRLVEAKDGKADGTERRPRAMPQ